jgi:hypothetical protein
MKKDLLEGSHAPSPLNPQRKAGRGMKEFIAVTVILISLAFSSVVLAATFKMNDGTTLEGQLAERSIKIKTSYGEASIKAQDVISYHDGVIKLRDGNTFKGIILNRSLKIKTSTGSIAVDPLKLLSFEL